MARMMLRLIAPGDTQTDIVTTTDATMPSVGDIVESTDGERRFWRVLERFIFYPDESGEVRGALRVERVQPRDVEWVG